MLLVCGEIFTLTIEFSFELSEIRNFTMLVYAKNKNTGHIFLVFLIAAIEFFISNSKCFPSERSKSEKLSQNGWNEDWILSEFLSKYS